MVEDYEFVQVSVARYTDLLEQKGALEKRILELEHHIEKIEGLLQRACDYANYDWVTIDIKDIKKVMDVKEEEENE